MSPNLLLSKRLGILTIVILVIVSVFAYISPPTVKATKLLVTSPTAFIDLGESTELTVKAIDEVGNLDSSRNDFVELNVKSISHSVTMARLSDTKIRLENGIGTFHIVGEVPEVVDVIATWEDGQSPLKPSTVRIFIGIGEE